MAVLRLSIFQTEGEWGIIERVINEKNNGKKLCHKGKGFNQYIASEINKNFGKQGDKNGGNVKVGLIQKNFTINVSDDIFHEIKRQSNLLSIPPTTLIKRLILDPHLLGK